MKIEIVEDDGELAERASDILCEQVATKPRSVLGLPTGSTPIAMYFEIGRRVEALKTDFSGITAFAVDEFLGPERNDAGTNSAFFRQYVRFPLKALHVPNPAAQAPDEHIAAYADAVRRAGGFDLCVLGVGTNGHVAFNEPGSPRDSRARAVALGAATREAHAAAFGSLEVVPERGVTLGIADLMEARRILMLAQGPLKAAIVRQAIEGRVMAELPATWLREHADITWIIDEGAAATLARRP